MSQKRNDGENGPRIERAVRKMIDTFRKHANLEPQETESLLVARITRFGLREYDNGWHEAMQIAGKMYRAGTAKPTQSGTGDI